MKTIVTGVPLKAFSAIVVASGVGEVSTPGEGRGEGDPAGEGVGGRCAGPGTEPMDVWEDKAVCSVASQTRGEHHLVLVSSVLGKRKSSACCQPTKLNTPLLSMQELNIPVPLPCVFLLVLPLPRFDHAESNTWASECRISGPGHLSPDESSRVPARLVVHYSRGFREDRNPPSDS